MSIHHCTLIVDGPVLQDGAIIDRLFEAGCDDAATGRSDGIQYVDFDREAASLDEAVLSAIRDVEHIDGVSVVRAADAGIVSMTDIASRIGRTRESVRLLITDARGPGGFPAPVTDPRGRHRLWRWFDVTPWITTQFGEAGLPDDRFLTRILHEGRDSGLWGVIWLGPGSIGFSDARRKAPRRVLEWFGQVDEGVFDPCRHRAA